MRAERWVGTADLPNFFRKPYGAGWALVGDAGYHKDPVTANGISDAFRDAGLLAEALDAGFAGRRTLDKALAGYEQLRNIVAAPLLAAACQAATFGPLPPEVFALRAALRDNPEATSQYFGTVAQSVSAREFFAPENLGGSWRLLPCSPPNAAVHRPTQPTQPGVLPGCVVCGTRSQGANLSTDPAPAGRQTLAPYISSLIEYR